MNELETIQINFSEHGLTVLNIILGFILFGISLELKKEDFIALLKNKKTSIVGLTAHFLLLPLLTFALVKLLHPPPSVALGMILVGACPGGNMSNMFTHMAKGNTALAVGLTSVSHMLAIVMTPFNFSFYGGLDSETAALLKTIHLDVFEVFQTIIFVIGIPLIAGIALNYSKPLLAEKLCGYMKKFSLVAFAIFLVAAFAGNAKVFIANFPVIMPLVIIHNAVALTGGYLFARLMRLEQRDVKTITFETGVQNAGLGLILIFTFFNGLGGMAIIAASWGVWHLVSGGALAYWWGRKSS
ncbi:MAG TPA: bile acid:sodium symporter family protein [Chitinophagales bacterium]|nr:bile acid:sodium symporter family protein [Chitinophagales bacterium]